jgi:hypothetical protein
MARASIERWRTRKDELSDFERRALTFEGRERTVFVAGSGPAVVVMTEMPGISPEVARFARIVRDAGFTVYMPALFGEPGRPLTLPYAVAQIARGCVSREFRALSRDVSAPATRWMRALAKQAHEECGGRGELRALDDARARRAGPGPLPAVVADREPRPRPLVPGGAPPGPDPDGA